MILREGISRRKLFIRGKRNLLRQHTRSQRHFSSLLCALTKMGDHPVIWTNENMKARNVYIFMGHHPDLFENQEFTTIFHNAILWASQR